MPPPSPILEFAGVTTAPSTAYDAPLRDVSFSLVPGDLLLVHLLRMRERSPLMDAAQGLIDPESGRVLYRGVSWRRMRAPALAAARRDIGRVFAEEVWMSNLDVDEGITLAQRHHTHRPLAEVQRQAADLSRRLGLEALPRARPSTVRRAVLRRAQCARALMGGPLLLLLESPTSGVPELLDALIELTGEVRARGGAVLWATEHREVWGHPRMEPTGRLVLDHDTLRPARAEDDETWQSPSSCDA